MIQRASKSVEKRCKARSILMSSHSVLYGNNEAYMTRQYRRRCAACKSRPYHLTAGPTRLGHLKQGRRRDLLGRQDANMPGTRSFSNDLSGHADKGVLKDKEASWGSWQFSFFFISFIPLAPPLSFLRNTPPRPSKKRIYQSSWQTFNALLPLVLPSMSPSRALTLLSAET